MVVVVQLEGLACPFKRIPGKHFNSTVCKAMPVTSAYFQKQQTGISGDKIRIWQMFRNTKIHILLHRKLCEYFAHIHAGMLWHFCTGDMNKRVAPLFCWASQRSGGIQIMFFKEAKYTINCGLSSQPSANKFSASELLLLLTGTTVLWSIIHWLCCNIEMSNQYLSLLHHRNTEGEPNCIGIMSMWSLGKFNQICTKLDKICGPRPPRVPLLWHQ